MRHVKHSFWKTSVKSPSLANYNGRSWRRLCGNQKHIDDFGTSGQEKHEQEKKERERIDGMDVCLLVNLTAVFTNIHYRHRTKRKQSMKDTNPDPLLNLRSSANRWSIFRSLNRNVQGFLLIKWTRLSVDLWQGQIIEFVKGKTSEGSELANLLDGMKDSINKNFPQIYRIISFSTLIIDYILEQGKGPCFRSIPRNSAVNHRQTMFSF